jgi:hypothetical protein
MCRLIVFLAIALISSPSFAATDFCLSLTEAADRVARTKEPVHLSAWLEPETFACGPTGDDTKHFCDAAIAASGIEFAHRFPWLIRDCVIANGQLSSIRTTNEWTGLSNRKRLVNLIGTLHGAAVHINYVPSPDNGSQINIYGRYDVIIWRP